MASRVPRSLVGSTGADLGIDMALVGAGPRRCWPPPRSAGHLLRGAPRRRAVPPSAATSSFSWLEARAKGLLKSVECGAGHFASHPSPAVPPGCTPGGIGTRHGSQALLLGLARIHHLKWWPPVGRTLPGAVGHLSNFPGASQLTRESSATPGPGIIASGGHPLKLGAERHPAAANSAATALDLAGGLAVSRATSLARCSYAALVASRLRRAAAVPHPGTRRPRLDARCASATPAQPSAAPAARIRLNTRDWSPCAGGEAFSAPPVSVVRWPPGLRCPQVVGSRSGVATGRRGIALGICWPGGLASDPNRWRCSSSTSGLGVDLKPEHPLDSPGLVHPAQADTASVRGPGLLEPRTVSPG